MPSPAGAQGWAKLAPPDCCLAAEIEEWLDEWVVAGVLDLINARPHLGVGPEGEEGNGHGHGFIQLLITGAAHRVYVPADLDGAAGVGERPSVGFESRLAMLPAADVLRLLLAEHESIVVGLAVVEAERIPVELAEVDLESSHTDFPVRDAERAASESLVGQSAVQSPDVGQLLHQGKHPGGCVDDPADIGRIHGELNRSWHDLRLLSFFLDLGDCHEWQM